MSWRWIIAVVGLESWSRTATATTAVTPFPIWSERLYHPEPSSSSTSGYPLGHPAPPTTFISTTIHSPFMTIDMGAIHTRLREGRSQTQVLMILN